ncbi:hypothetical protein ACWLZS_004560 [Vibrio parahaemolyticus]|uniref:hypothetical protein n=1 Tax=Vibrio parahaemolyticus TaxID=670 RepID=UPI0015B9CBA6|nr:hypothetical protein [Vibrio parahaemolyticus]QLE30606.1 hypothetical protein FDV78_08480 [Vibrio parahaemolyticus]
MTWTIIVALLGWFFAVFQFVFSYRETREKNEAELLEKTLNYFNQGTHARTIGISLVEGIWLKRKKNLEIILPVLIAQVLYLLTKDSLEAQEHRDIVRLLFLIEKLIPFESEGSVSVAEISEALMWGAQNETAAQVNLRHWYKKFNGNADMWDAELNT